MENCLTTEAKNFAIAPEGAMVRPSVGVRIRLNRALSAIDEAMPDAENKAPDRASAMAGIHDRKLSGRCLVRPDSLAARWNHLLPGRPSSYPPRVPTDPEV